MSLDLFFFYFMVKAVDWRTKVCPLYSLVLLASTLMHRFQNKQVKDTNETQPNSGYARFGPKWIEFICKMPFAFNSLIPADLQQYINPQMVKWL